MTVAMAHPLESLGEVGAAAVLYKVTNRFKTVMAKHKTTRAQIQVEYFSSPNEHYYSLGPNVKL